MFFCSGCSNRTEKTVRKGYELQKYHLQVFWAFLEEVVFVFSAIIVCSSILQLENMENMHIEIEN